MLASTENGKFGLNWVLVGGAKHIKSGFCLVPLGREHYTFGATRCQTR